MIHVLRTLTLLAAGAVLTGEPTASAMVLSAARLAPAMDEATVRRSGDTLPLVFVNGPRGGGGGGHRGPGPGNRPQINRAHVNQRNFNSNNFRRDVTVNRNVYVNNRGYNGGYYGPNWGGVAAGVAVGVGVTAAATAAANAAAYPPPPPYPPYGYPPPGYYYQPN